MEDKEKTKEQLMDELVRLRRQITNFEKSEIKYRQTEETLSENEEKYRILIELIDVGIQVETVEGRVLECNTAGAKIYGYTKEEMIGLTLADLVPEEFAKKLPKVITDKETSNGIFVPRISRKKDGAIFPTEIATKIINIGGKPRLIAYVRDITKRKEAEKRLRKARKMFASLFNSSPEASLYHDKVGRIININPRFTELFGFTPEEMIGKKIDEGMIYPENKTEEGERLTKNGLTFKGVSDYETIRKKKDGTLVPVIISAASVIIDKKTQGTIALYRDITERKKAEESLQKSQQEFSSLFKSSPEALVYLDEEANILDINSRFTKLFGYTLKEIKGRNIDDGMIHLPDKIEEGKRLSKNGFEGRLNYETVRKKKDGTLFPVHISSAPLIIKGEKKGFIGVYQDITERKEFEETLRKSQQEFAGLFRNNPEALVYLDEKGNIIDINPRFNELFGYTLEEIKGKNINEGMIHPPDKVKEGKDLDKIALNKGYSHYETIRKKKDGTLFPVSISVANIKINGQIKGLIGTFLDITERKEFEETLRKSQQEFASIFRNNPEALVYVDEKGNIININPRFTELFGYTLKEIKGRNIDGGIIHPKGRLKEGENLTKGSFEGYLNYETIRKKKDGTLFPVSISVSKVVIDGKLKGGMGIYIDITTRKQLEEELEKLAHFDALTGCCSRGHGLALLEQQIKTANRKKNSILLLYLDVDKLKEINDTFGHKEGDKVLKEVVQLFKSTLREIDIICRIGGDEFLLIFPDSSLDDASLIKERLSKNLEKLNQSLNEFYKISFSIGLSYYNPSDPLSIEELIKIADVNMYKEKKKTKEEK